MGERGGGGHKPIAGWCAGCLTIGQTTESCNLSELFLLSHHNTITSIGVHRRCSRDHQDENLRIRQANGGAGKARSDQRTSDYLSCRLVKRDAAPPSRVHRRGYGQKSRPLSRLLLIAILLTARERESLVRMAPGSQRKVVRSDLWLRLTWPAGSWSGCDDWKTSEIALGHHQKSRYAILRCALYSTVCRTRSRRRRRR